MNNKITNPYLKQLISEISTKTSQGRISDISWGAIDEVKKKKKIKEVGDKKDKKQPDETQKDEKTGDLPPIDSGDNKDMPVPPSDIPDETSKANKAPEGEDVPKADTTQDANQEDTDKAEADAAEAKAKLEKAKAEKDQAEKELKDQSYVKLGSSSGTEFLLGKVLNTAFKTNTIDALAREMVQKLKIQTIEDMNLFSEEVAPYMTIPGMADLITSMKPLTTKQSDTSTEEPAA